MDEYNRLFDNDKLLEPGFMISMYARGSFPMAEEGGVINWYLPKIRAVIPIEKFNIPKSLKKFMKTALFEYRFDCDTISVIKNCSNRNETWISPDLIEAYEKLINLGYVHSVEVYQKDELVGGLYGIAFRGAFFGESMFSKVPQASKCAMVKLFENLKIKGYDIVDVQYITNHLAMFGTIEIPYDDYVEILVRAYKKEIEFI
ncbi:MAG: leucyl/phenylalanyl-tRNA--protein transferase [Bacteroidetes bacterium]|nr:leucyl/phenylalanyl-tRNA--protein transferase [Bacteroidota bacterium]MBU1116864.1 leucyl/phenylalanyl-tRNA--protein transferase [Bacteroidota bacterium]MBU1797458.1 leucyl/phenylalanyl-tRNA--protein transferase [Bacteroidota bacterium]